MIEEIILNYLDNALDVPVYMEEPENPPKGYVIIEKTGSRRTNYVNGATFAFQSYGSSLYNAAALNEMVKNAMDDIISLSEIGASKLNSDYNFTDPNTHRYRYQAVYDITHY